MGPAPYVGTAAWNISKDHAGYFGQEGSHLQRYAQVLNAVEINSSFYKEHQAKSYVRWANDTPAEFRFSVKLSKVFTHESGLRPDEKKLLESLDRICHLGEKFGVLLLQLPGKQNFEASAMEDFYRMLRRKISIPIALEPRNLSWLCAESVRLMQEFAISKVQADPEKCLGEVKSKSHQTGVDYYRLHGSPLIYKSAYSEEYLQQLLVTLKSKKNPWCVFDNTTFGHATENAVTLHRMWTR
ncbi:MAG TPA: DUF72 domain-containing protein [Bacteriovoracaceae bacterium]|nr:DUF72 domain-containing protein [Bacteriovoracaceae bacterium]